jgi:beta-glucosidase
MLCRWAPPQPRIEASVRVHQAGRAGQLIEGDQMRTPTDWRPPRLRSVVIASAAALALSLVGTSTAWAGTTLEIDALEAANNDLSRLAATEGMVLLENHDSVLPVPKGNLAVFGVGAYTTVKGGTGSGEVNQRAQLDDYNILTGLTEAGYTITTNPDYLAADKAAFENDECVSPESFFSVAYTYALCEQPLTDAWLAPTAPTSEAVFVVTRNAGEAFDRSSGKNDYLLGDVERANIERIAAAYDHFSVILNVGGVVDTEFFNQVNEAVTGPDGSQGIDGLLLMSQAGQQSGQALADVLSGAANPSGHLVDSWAAAYDYYPASASFADHDGVTATEDYSEGVYVGYRYFDSFYKAINPADPAAVLSYPYGYGLSYTDFTIKPVEVTISGEQIAAQVAVTNTGQVAGKQVVQVYVSAPTSGVDKPYQELAAYAKTDLLAPGQCQLLTLSFYAHDLASYHEAEAAWVLDGGDYIVRVGDSSRSTVVAARVNLASNKLVEQLSSQMVDDQSVADELTADPANFYSYDSEPAEIAAAPVLMLDPGAIVAQDNASPYQQSVNAATASGVGQVDQGLVSAITAYVDQATAGDWEGTGAAYNAQVGETVTALTVDPGATLADVKSGQISMEQFVAGLSVEQLARIAGGISASDAKADSSVLLAEGSAFWSAPIEELDIAAMAMPDGPAGLRLSQQYQDAEGNTLYQWATAFPIETMLAQTWNNDLLQEVGMAIGKEMVEYGATLWLAPGLNIHRDPLNGRNFEYYSEDPLQTGLAATAVTLGVQSQPGVGVTLKHFAMNNQETDRGTSNAVASERAIREIYLKGFEMTVKSAQPMAFMSSFNKINGTWAPSNYDLLTDLLRGEWGFEGLVMTDYGGSEGVIHSMYSGNDLIEPGNDSAEIVGSLLDIPMDIDVNGLPVDSPGQTWGRIFHSFAFNGIIPAVDGPIVSEVTVDAEAILEAPRSLQLVGTEQIVPMDKYPSVQAAYDNACEMLTWMTQEQAAAITITPTYAPSDPGAVAEVVSYTVAIHGAYPVHEMRLGDLQRSVMHILSVDMWSNTYADLTDTAAVSYSGRFTDLRDYLQVTAAVPVSGCDQYCAPIPAPSAPAKPGAAAETGGQALPDRTAGTLLLLGIGLVALGLSAGGRRRNTR